MSYLNWHVGMKVVCVDASRTNKYIKQAGFDVGSGTMDGLRQGVVYTIRRIGVDLGVPVVWLREIERPICPITCEEAGYAAGRFRKLVTRSSDISIFTAMLNPNKQVENA